MGGCLGTEELEPRNHLIVDVQQIIADDAWEEFVISSRRRCRLGRLRLKRSDYAIEVPMNYYHFQVTHQKFTHKKSLPSLQSGDTQARKKDSSQAVLQQANPDQIGLKTEFRNDTDKDQTYNFRMEKARRATVQVSYQRGFSIGGSANFTLGLPKVLPEGELSTEINMTYEVTNSRGQEFEESLTTEATSEIVVSRNHHCTAQVVMEERRLLADFTVRVMMHMPEKAGIVQIKDKTGRVVFLKVIENLSMLFPAHTHLKDDQNETRIDAVQFEIHGFVDGMQLANHYIHLKSRKIPTEGKAPKRPKPTKGDRGAIAEDGVEEEESEEEFFPDLQKLGYKPGF